jgi:glucose/arabinose dehydrogenase
MLGILGFVLTCHGVLAQEDFVPRRQDKPPGPALSPRDAIAKMTVPDGFSVELVAGEPDIQNPVAMTFDERGRIWITESFEYPRFEPGPGRDRVKVLEDTDGDGTADKVTIFADGLNIPSGIAVGHGGVWVANAPDILFMQDTDGDGKADKREVVVTGFGRDDTHELPNSLGWGPDGYLYGLNGVFNNSHVKQNGKDFQFTCAMFRIDPRTRKFEVFAEGTSNPWGIAWDPQGSAFISACVIDHLWHITESGYYHRQGGPYPPFTWKIDSIVDYTHQLAAYCGIEYFDSDAYPAEYRDRLYMGNIHGGCINVDELSRSGSTYRGKSAPDFLTANDVWFMPVAQKIGPDGCLYVLDWYDRFHCYQDARALPDKVDRGHGRLYRVRYKDTPRAKPFDLSKESGDELIARLHSPNLFYRSLAQRILVERADAATNNKLAALVLDEAAAHKTRMHALWSLVGQGSLDAEFHAQLLNSPDASLRAWGVRAAGNFATVDDGLRDKIATMSADGSADVLLQVAIAAGKIEGLDPLSTWVEVLANSGDDELIPHIVWQNLHPRLPERIEEFLALVKAQDLETSPNLKKILPRVTERILANKK